jgi:hypothetical protein
MLATTYWVPVSLSPPQAVILIFHPTNHKESPRWLVTRNRDEEAFEILMKTHKSKNDPYHVSARREVRRDSVFQKDAFKRFLLGGSYFKFGNKHQLTGHFGAEQATRHLRGEASTISFLPVIQK